MSDFINLYECKTCGERALFEYVNKFWAFGNECGDCAQTRDRMEEMKQDEIAAGCWE
jgi:hypothetical protein